MYVAIINYFSYNYEPGSCLIGRSPAVGSSLIVLRDFSPADIFAGDGSAPQLLSSGRQPPANPPTYLILIADEKWKRHVIEARSIIYWGFDRKRNSNRMNINMALSR